MQVARRGESSWPHALQLSIASFKLEKKPQWQTPPTARKTHATSRAVRSPATGYVYSLSHLPLMLSAAGARLGSSISSLTRKRMIDAASCYTSSMASAYHTKHPQVRCNYTSTRLYPGYVLAEAISSILYPYAQRRSNKNTITIRKYHRLLCLSHGAHIVVQIEADLEKSAEIYRDAIET